MKTKGTPGRREFLKKTTQALATAAVCKGMPTAARAETPGQSAGPIPTRTLGKTGLDLPILGMGTSQMVPALARTYGAPPRSAEQRAALVRCAYDRGVRYFDTARLYTEAERVLGLGLKEVRKDCFVATKVAVFDPAQVRQSVETSLGALGMDKVDAVQIHNPVLIKTGFDGTMKIRAELAKLRDEGLFKFIGVTTHVAYETMYKLIATGGFDLALLAVSYFPKGKDTLLSEQNLKFREMCLDKAQELKVAVVAMKVMCVSIFGRMSKYIVPDYDPAARKRLPGAAMRWVMNDKRVSLMVIGMTYAEEIDENRAVLTSDLSLTEGDRALLTDYTARVRETDYMKKMRIE
ncbi:MAG: aldo/keto reductase [Planctomycetota bacterium]